MSPSEPVVDGREEFSERRSSEHTVSRRRLLKQGATAVVGGGAALLGGSALTQAQAGQVADAPRGSAKSLAGTRYRAFVTYGKTARTSSVETLTLRPIQPRQVVVRTEASQACYSVVNALAPAPRPVPAAGAPLNPNASNAVTVGHFGVGVVEEVGPDVRRVQVGDRVIVANQTQCGQCWLCLHGRADLCAAAQGRPNLPIADMADGTPVMGGAGGLAEFMVIYEEQTVPIKSNAPAAELSMLSCPITAGLGLAMMRAPVEPGADVVVFGAGPVGLSAVQGARILGAAQIIVIEPVKYRRDLALKVGATAVLDPNVDKGMDLITKIRGMCKLPFDRAFAGSRGPNPNTQGPMYVLEAVGGDRFAPKVEAGPDPTGVEVLQQVWTLCPPGGVMRTCSIGQPAGTNVVFPAAQWANASKTHMPGNFTGVQILRDIPAFARLIDTKHFDAASLVGQTFPLERAREALEVSAYRTAITGVVTFT